MKYNKKSYEIYSHIIFQAKYTDPQTKLRYATPDEYTQIRMLPSDLVTGLLALRKANIPVP